MVIKVFDFTSAVASINPVLLIATGTVSLIFIVYLSDVRTLLSNPDSRDKVNDSIAEYEALFAGARKDVGKTSTSESIKQRAKEYKTLVDNFYDLVTDFYEWGWGQVSTRVSL